MSDKFDPYHQWLGIPASEQPPNHYRLLGIAPFESDSTVIENAADRLMAQLRTFQAGKHSQESQRLLNEVAAARICLLNAEKKALYDHYLRKVLRKPQVPPPPPPLPGRRGGIPRRGACRRPRPSIRSCIPSDLARPLQPRRSICRNSANTNSSNS